MPEATDDPPPPRPAPSPVVDSRALLDGNRERVILHGPERYRLLLTSRDKLILTK